jgi:hypothetical protein
MTVYINDLVVENTYIGRKFKSAGTPTSDMERKSRNDRKYRKGPEMIRTHNWVWLIK